MCVCYSFHFFFTHHCYAHLLSFADWSVVYVAHCQPLGYLLRCNRVIIPGGKAEEKKDITDSLCALDKLIHILSSVEAEHASSGFAPGFFTKELDCEKWVVNNNGLFDDQYENLLNVEMNGLVVPLPSCENALAYLKAVRETWIEREKWAAAQMNEGSTASFCSCISAWAHDNSRNPTMMQLMNQVLEQVSNRGSKRLETHTPLILFIVDDNRGQ